MEQLVLTTPIVTPEKVTSRYRVYSLLMSPFIPATGANVPPIPLLPGGVTVPPAPEPGVIMIQVIDNQGEIRAFSYLGTPAVTLITAWGHADLTTKSLNTRVLEQLAQDGHLVGTVTNEE